MAFKLCVYCVVCLTENEIEHLEYQEAKDPDNDHLLPNEDPDRICYYIACTIAIASPLACKALIDDLTAFRWQFGLFRCGQQEQCAVIDRQDAGSRDPARCPLRRR